MSPRFALAFLIHIFFFFFLSSKSALPVVRPPSRPPAALVDSYGCISATCAAAAAAPLTLTFLHGLPKWSWTVHAHGVRFIFSHHMMWRRAQVAAGTTLAHNSCNSENKMEREREEIRR